MLLPGVQHQEGVIRQSCTLQSEPPDIFSAHLTPYKIITTLAIFLKLLFTSPCFVTTGLYFLTPPPFPQKGRVFNLPVYSEG